MLNLNISVYFGGMGSVGGHCSPNNVNIDASGEHRAQKGSGFGWIWGHFGSFCHSFCRRFFSAFSGALLFVTVGDVGAQR